MRAERAASGPGRTYVLEYAARDAAANSASALAIVTVPCDLANGPDPIQIRVEPGSIPGMVHAYWGDVTGAQAYDVISGDVASLGFGPARVSLGVVRVPARLITVPAWTEDSGGLVPESGQAIFYLVQYRDRNGPTGFGIESVPLPREPDSCADVCPGEETQTTSYGGGGPIRK